MYPYVNIPKDSILFFANFTINILLPIVIMGITYRKIFTILHQSAIFRRNSATSTEDIFSDDKRVIITLILVLGVFIVCWLPYVVYIFLALMLEDKNDIPSYINPLVSKLCNDNCVNKKKNNGTRTTIEHSNDIYMSTFRFP